MKTLEQKAKYYLAKYCSLTNAAEFIRSHGEEGFAFEDKSFDKEYKRQNLETANQLNARADKYLKKYKETGVEISTEIDSNY